MPAQTNTAAQIAVEKAHPLKVQKVPYPTPGDGEVVVKVGAAALNPVDFIIQELGNDLISFLQYPLTIGSDVAGTIIELGPGIAKFSVGDRVLGLNGNFSTRAGGYQQYTALEAKCISKIPDSLSFADASVLPLCLGTAASGLFQKDYLALDYPSVDPKPQNGKTLLVWAGASGVGSNAIQLTAAAGYKIITTASPKNFQYYKQLGAAQVFDYNSGSVRKDLVTALKGKQLAGAYAIQPASADIVFNVMAQSEGSRFVAIAYPVPEKVPEGITAKMVWGGSLKDNKVGPIIFNKFLPGTLAAGNYQCAPGSKVFGHGLDKVQNA
ncbi:GroES-like protein [Xylariaceae sp. FL0804]|nr:GroES-like protein [Xylariaceae sp. FL0804]